MTNLCEVVKNSVSVIGIEYFGADSWTVTPGEADDHGFHVAGAFLSGEPSVMLWAPKLLSRQVCPVYLRPKAAIKLASLIESLAVFPPAIDDRESKRVAMPDCDVMSVGYSGCGQIVLEVDRYPEGLLIPNHTAICGDLRRVARCFRKQH